MSWMLNWNRIRGFLCDVKPTVYCMAWSYLSRDTLRLRTPPVGFYCLFLLIQAATQLTLEDCVTLGGASPELLPPFFVIINLLPCSKRASVFCAPPLVSVPLMFLEQDACVNVFPGFLCKPLMKLAGILHQFGYLAAVSIWLLRKCKSSSWPALPFPLVPC